ncbi:MAG: hypothetical protein M3Q73_03095 [bacterium]|nr:hypothetical protein [bacterium]
MIPRTDFQIHEIFMQTFFFPEEYGADRSQFDKDAAEFMGFFKQHEEKILQIIEKFSGFDWSKEKIPVFVVPNNSMISYSYTKFDLQDGLPGVVQKIFRNQQRNLHIFIHELAHVNQRHADFYDRKYKTLDEEGNRNVDLVEVCADIVCLYVIREIFSGNSEYERDMFDFLQNTGMKNKRKYAELEKSLTQWDLYKNPLKFYIAK